MGWLQNKFEKNFLISTVDYVFNWARKSAVWPMTFGLACCAIEMIASSTARFDIARFGSEVFRPSPRQSDLMIVAGTVTLKMAPVIKRIYDQMPDPKWVISMGACSSVGGPFNTYAVLQGVDKIVPTDVYVIGCPPRPENLFYALLKLQDKIDQMSLAKRPTEVRLDPAGLQWDAWPATSDRSCPATSAARKTNFPDAVGSRSHTHLLGRSCRHPAERRKC